MIIGSVVNPRTEVLKKKLRFTCRDNSPFETPPDDPDYYAKHGGGFGL